jgi:hypothetical protein
MLHAQNLPNRRVYKLGESHLKSVKGEVVAIPCNHY